MTGTAASVASERCISFRSLISGDREALTWSLGLRSHLNDARGAARGAGGVEADEARGGAGEDACEHV
jgi:hypothetical protein